MKNIPMFTTEAGAASLILEEIPYKKAAYIKFQASQTPEQLLKECIDFCRVLGAEEIYASGHTIFENYPLHTEIIRMECDKSMLVPGKMIICPIDESNVRQWCDIYNARMENVPNAATLTVSKVKILIPDKVCYLIYDGEQLLGIGKIDGNKIDVIATVVPGKGSDVMYSLCDMVTGETVSVEVAANNTPAIRLYEKLGFQKTDTISVWYSVNNL